MKKSTKKILIIACMLIIIGIGLTVVAFASGGGKEIYWDNKAKKFVTEDSMIKVESEKKKVDKFDEIEINADIDINFIPADDYYLEYNWSSFGNDIIEIKDDKLIFVSEDNKGFHIGFSFRHEKEGYVNIYYPSDANFDIVNITQNMGEGNIEDLNAKTLIIDCDMGDFTVTNIKVESLDATFSMGDFSMTNSKIGDFNISCDMGDVNLESCDIEKLEAELEMGVIEGDEVSIKKSSSISCDMGDIELVLKGKPEMYSIIAQAEMGDVSIEGGEGNNSDIKLDLSCDMGDIEVEFSK